MKLLSTLLCLFIAFNIVAQDFPTPIIGHAFVKSGVENASPGKGLSIQYVLHPTYMLNSALNGENAALRSEVDSKERIDVKLKVPIMNKDYFRMLVGLYHSFEKYDFTTIEPEGNPYFNKIDNQKLKRSRLSLILFKPLDDKNYLALRLGASFNGDYSGLIEMDQRYAVYKGALIWGFKRRADREFGFGLLINSSFQRTSGYPFLIWNRTFNDKWGIESVLPVRVAVRRNFNDGHLLLGGVEYWSSAYSLDVLDPSNGPDPAIYFFKSSAAHLYLDWQKRMFSEWTWIRLKTGLAYNFDSKFINKVTDESINAFPSNSFFFSVGFFVSPPSDKEGDLN